LYALYLFVGVFGAQTLVGVMEKDVFGRGINPAAIWIVDRTVPTALARDFLVGEYGVVTMGLTLRHRDRPAGSRDILLIFGFLEDSGYIPRLAIFCDRVFRVMGLNGKAVLPMVLGLGCDTMATMTTRFSGRRRTADRDPAVGPWRAVLRAAGDHHGHPRRHLGRRAGDAVWRRADPNAGRRLAGGAGAQRRAVAVHPRTPADSLAAAR
jgi:hypothetical protein